MAGLTVSTRCDTDPKNLVQDVGFSIQAGEILCVAGPSGGGKTLTGLAIANLLPPTLKARGVINIGGSQRNLFDMSKREWTGIRGDTIAYIAQDSMGSLHPAHSVGSQITEAIKCHRSLSKKEAQKEVSEILAQVELTSSIRASFPNELSGGMKQRVALAIALVNNPDVLIADETTTALDPETRARILTLLRTHVDQSGKALVLFSHDLKFVAETIDTVAVMDGGQLVEHGAKENIFTTPKTKTAKELVDAATKTFAPASGRELSPEPVLSVKNLSVRFKRGPVRWKKIGVLEDVSFEVFGGEMVGLVGKSGSGKTTIARIISGLQRATKGTVAVRGVDNHVHRKPQPNPLVQLVFQNPYGCTDPCRPVLDQVCDPLIAKGIGCSVAQKLASRMLNDLGISGKKQRNWPRSLSGGQLQRVGIARALISNPKVLVLDEPVASLDLPIRHQIVDIITDLQKDLNFACLFISHNTELVKQVCHRVLVLDKGRIYP